MEATDLPACTAALVPHPTSIWHRDHQVVKSDFSNLVVQFILMSLTYQLVRFLLRPLKQPKFVCSVLAGILLGPGGLGRIKSIKETLSSQKIVLLSRTVASLGITYFVFLSAVKMDPGLIRRTARKASVIGLFSILVTFATVLLLVYNYRGDGIKTGFFRCLFAAGLSAIRFPNMSLAFDELKLLTSELGQLCLSLSMIGELFTWIWLVIGISFRQSAKKKLPKLRHFSKFFWVLPVASLAAFLLFMAFIVRPAMKYIVRRMPDGKPVQDLITITILVGALIIGFISDLIGSTHIGVLVMGLVIPDGPPLGAAIIEKSELIVEEFLMPLFYVIVGVHTDVGKIKFQDQIGVIMLVFAAFIAKFAGTAVSALSCRFNFDQAVVLGFMTNIRGPFDIYLFSRWRRARETTKDVFTVLVVSQMVITAIVTPLIEIFYDAQARMGCPAGKNAKALQTTPSNAEFRVISCIHQEESAPGLMYLLQAANPTAASPICAYILHLNELIGRAAPVIIPHNSKQIKRAWSKKSYHMWRAFNIFLSNSNGFIRIKAFTMIAPYDSMHENICKLALDESIPFIIIPFHGNPEIDSKQAAAIHGLNKNIEAHAPCTVGLLVDRGLRHFASQDGTFIFKVALVFMGGPDDREALSFATRLWRHQNVVVSMLRLIVPNVSDVIEDIIEKRLDDALVDEFRRKSAEGSRSFYREAVVEDMVQIVKELRTLENKFNLTIVGKQRQSRQSVLDHEMMLEWSENPDLGVLGDLIASPDFEGSDKTSLLVMHHRGNMIEWPVLDQIRRRVSPWESKMLTSSPDLTLSW